MGAIIRAYNLSRSFSILNQSAHDIGLSIIRDN
jgi:hypothetical protein